MSSALRTQASSRLAQSFSATAPKVAAVRHLSISGPREASPALVSFESAMANIPKRSDIIANGRNYNTSRTMKQVNDSSTVDFAYFPASYSAAGNQDYTRMPLLPDNHLVRHAAPAAEPHVAKAEISTATYTDVVATLSEADVSKAADVLGLSNVAEGAKKEMGVVMRVLGDMVDDVLGVKSKTTTA